MQKTPNKKILIRYFVVALIVGLLSFGTYYAKKYTDLLSSVQKGLQNINPSGSKGYIDTYPRIALQDLWTSYKNDFIQNDGRTIDKSSNLITTSEGQSYSLLKAVWVDDKQTFDTVWKWTNTNLKKRPTDKLFAWKWGKNPDTSWGIMTADGGLNTASDADQDIALALILANNRWNDSYYLDQARATLTDIWNTEVVTINGRPYMTAGNWANQPNAIIVNPSYYSLAAYSLFQKIDPMHDWNGVKDTSYEILNSATQTLPPDWASVSKTDLSVTPIGLNGKGVEFSHDALRIPWRVALDWKWNKDDRAMAYMKKLSVLDNEWKSSQMIREQYALNGSPLTSQDNLSMYGSLLPFMQLVDPASAQQILDTKISPRFNPDKGTWNEQLGYYDSNWLWFGLALYLDNAVNLLPERTS